MIEIRTTEQNYGDQLMTEGTFLERAEKAAGKFYNADKSTKLWKQHRAKSSLSTPACPLTGMEQAIYCSNKHRVFFCWFRGRLAKGSVNKSMIGWMG